MNPTESDVLSKAEGEINAGNIKSAFELLHHLIEERNPAALFLYAHFSIRDVETEDEYDARRIEILQSLADLGYAPAIYEFAVCCEIGDLVRSDPIRASNLYRRAAELGYPKAKLSYGLDLYYG